MRISNSPAIDETTVAQANLSHGLIVLSELQSGGEHYDFVSEAPLTDVTYMLTNSGIENRRVNAFFDISDHSAKQSHLGQLVVRPHPVALKVAGEFTGLTRIIMCRFDSNFFEEMTGLKGWDDQAIKRCGNLRSRSIESVMRQMAKELITPQFSSEMAIEMLSNLVLIEIGRLFSPRATASTTSFRNLAPWQLRKIDECLHSVENRWPMLDELAQLCGISAKYLSHAFSQTMGIPLTKYAERIRVDRAKSLLTQAQLPINQIASMLGFPNPNYFSVAFRRSTGETPSAFAQRSRSTAVE